MTTPTNLPSGFEGLGAATDSVHKFEFTGDARSMWPLVLKNLLFNILTLSLYRFWGRTHVRRYIWENVRFKGDPLEYTGEGKELFIGFLVVLFAFFLPVTGMILWSQTLIAEGNPAGTFMFLAVYGLFLFLMPLAYFRANKYRLSRTRWRGIRGALIGNGVDYALAAIGYGLLSIITFGLAIPYMENQLYKKMTNKTRFGSGHFQYNAGSGPIYSGFFAYIGVAAIGFVIYMAVFAGTFMTLPQEISQTDQTNPTELSGHVITMFIWLFISYAVFLFFMGIGLAIYMHTKFRHFYSNTHYQTACFHFSGTLGDMIKMYIGNFLLLVVTLGIAFPITQMRFVRYVTSNLMMEGELDLGTIQQSSEDEPGYGEGLAEGFDMGTI